MKNGDESVFSMCLTHPFFLICQGRSQSGKTTFLLDLLLRKEQIIDKPIKKIIYVYGSDQTSFHDERIKKLNIVFTDDLDGFEKFVERDSILIFDDVFLQLKQKKYNNIITDYAIRKSHHQSVSVIFLVQSMFEEKFAILRENAKYTALFKPNQNRAKTLRFLGQLYPGMRQFCIESLNRASRSKYSYLFISFDDNTSSIYSLRNSLFPDQNLEIYTPKNETDIKGEKIPK